MTDRPILESLLWLGPDECIATWSYPGLTPPIDAVITVEYEPPCPDTGKPFPSWSAHGVAPDSVLSAVEDAAADRAERDRDDGCDEDRDWRWEREQAAAEDAWFGGAE